MRVALIAPPFIPVPPIEYGGTELFIAHLAEELQRQGVEVVVYTNGESQLSVETRWLFQQSHWPIKHDEPSQLKDLDHTSWAVADAVHDCDIIHFNTAQGLVFSRFVQLPFVYTIHHANHPDVSQYYSRFPGVNYVCISQSQCQREPMPKTRAIHHGIRFSDYRLRTEKQQYLSFVGRIAPIKGTHLAIEIAKHSGIPLKIAGEVQPAYRDYFEAKIRPQIDGKFIEYVGLADLPAKNELLGNSLAMLFPIQWDEPFGLVMVEAMACGTPVLAIRGGSVPEVIDEGVSGFIGRSVKDLVKRISQLPLPAERVRHCAEERFSTERMAKDYLRLYNEVLSERETSRPAQSVDLQPRGSGTLGR
jgi:glycosyltransferase involved in cell wall biosynthesis